MILMGKYSDIYIYSVLTGGDISQHGILLRKVRELKHCEGLVQRHTAQLREIGEGLKNCRFQSIYIYINYFRGTI